MGQLTDPNLHFPSRPAFIDDLVTFQMPDGLGFQFRAAEAPVVLRGKRVESVVAHLLERMDGSRTVQDLLSELPPQLPPSAVARTLLILHSKGLLSGGALQPSAAGVGLAQRDLLFWGRHLAITRSAGSAGEVARRIATARLGLVGTGLLGSVTADLLMRSGFEHLQVLAWNDDGPMELLNGGPERPMTVRAVSPDVDALLNAVRSMVADIDMLVTITTDAPRRVHRGINDICLAGNRPWLGMNSDGSAVDIGPLVVPFEGACYECLVLRQASVGPMAIEDALFHEYLAGRDASAGRPLRGEALWPATLAASIIVADVTRWVSGIAAPTLVEAVVRVLPVSGVMERSEIQRVPRCPSCYRGEIAPSDQGGPMTVEVG